MNQSNIPQVITETICLSDDSDEGQGPETPKNSSQKPEERRSSRRKRIKMVCILCLVYWGEFYPPFAWQVEEKAEAIPKSMEKKPLEKSITKKKEPSPTTSAQPDETKPPPNRDPFKEILTGLEGKSIFLSKEFTLKFVFFFFRCCFSKSFTL